MVQANQQGTTQQKPVVLVVDDEPEFGLALATRLNMHEIPSSFVTCGNEAMLAIAHQQFEVVLLDINMPGMHGLKVLEIIKSQRPNLEVLLLTSENNLHTAVEGMRLGASDYLLKPADFDFLLKNINNARKRRSERKENIRAAEAGKLLALKSLATGVAHEVNNPLNVITQSVGLLEELIQETEPTPLDVKTCTQLLDKIRLATKRCAKITSQLLSLSYAEGTTIHPTDVCLLADKIIDIMRKKLEEHNIMIVKDYEQNLPLLKCSALDLEPVLTQVVVNAIDAMSMQKDEPIQHSLGILVHMTDEGLLIKISDTGEGITQDILPRIYEPFFSTRPVGKGVGLGLTVCHSLITFLRGEITHRAALPCGTTCTIKLPKELVLSTSK